MRITLSFPNGSEQSYNSEFIPRPPDLVKHGNAIYGIQDTVWRIPEFDVELILKERPK
jgi:hypothetical protein